MTDPKKTSARWYVEQFGSQSGYFSEVAHAVEPGLAYAQCGRFGGGRWQPATDERHCKTCERILAGPDPMRVRIR